MRFVPAHLLSRHRCFTLGFVGPQPPFAFFPSHNHYSKEPFTLHSFLFSSCQIPTNTQIFVFLYSPLQQACIIRHVLVHTFIEGVCVYVCDRGWVGSRGDLCVEQTFHIPNIGFLYIILKESLSLTQSWVTSPNAACVPPSCNKCCPTRRQNSSCYVDTNITIPCILTCFLKKQEGSGGRAPLYLSCISQREKFKNSYSRSLYWDANGSSLYTEWNYLCFKGLQYWDGGTSFFLCTAQYSFIFSSSLALCFPQRAHALHNVLVAEYNFCATSALTVAPNVALVSFAEVLCLPWSNFLHPEFHSHHPPIRVLLFFPAGNTLQSERPFVLHGWLTQQQCPRISGFSGFVFCWERMDFLGHPTFSFKLLLYL